MAPTRVCARHVFLSRRDTSHGLRTTHALTQTLALLEIVVIGAFLYSVLLMAAPLAGVGALLPIAFLYLAWRFVLAVERIAAAMEARAQPPEPVSGE